jgi:integrase/recombinase XerD
VETRQAIRSFILDREARNISRRTVRFYEQKLGKFCARHPQLPEAPDPIREFLRDLTCRDETRHGYFRALKALYTFLEEEFGFPLEAGPKSPYANPIKKVKAPRVKPKVMRSFGLEEVHRFLISAGGAREGKWKLRDETIVTLLLDNGIRAGEALLRWDQIDGHSIRVSGKTGEREVPITPRTRWLLDQLQAWNEAHFGPNPYVFLGKKGPLSPQGLYKVVRGALTRAGFVGRRLSPHTLRHTFARLWLTEGGDPYSLQQTLGHTTMDMVRRYVAMSGKERVRQHQQFSPVMTQARLAQGALWGESGGGPGGRNEEAEKRDHPLQHGAGAGGVGPG